MHNVLQILRRDFKRLVTVPAAWVIMIGLILIPPLYAWFNIYGFWNPYGNTDSIKVAVANMDEGTDNALLVQRLCVKPAGELADAVRVHGDIGNGLLGGQRPVLICVFLLFCFAQ